MKDTLTIHTSTERSVIETGYLRDAYRMALSILDSLETGSIGQITGEPGTGKTWAGKWLAEKLHAVRICCSYGLSNKALIQKLSEALNGESLSGSTHTLIRTLEKNATGRLLIVDEANHLRWQQLELLRYLADEAGTGILLIGTVLLERQFAEGRTATLLAQLSSRIGGKRIKFERLSDLNEITGYMIHPHFGMVDKATAQSFARHTRGYWRNGMELTATCRRLMKTHGIEKLTTTIVDSAAQWMRCSHTLHNTINLVQRFLHQIFNLGHIGCNNCFRSLCQKQACYQYSPGDRHDLNRDGKIDLKDVMLLQKMGN